MGKNIKLSETHYFFFLKKTDEKERRRKDRAINKMCAQTGGGSFLTMPEIGTNFNDEERFFKLNLLSKAVSYNVIHFLQNY